MSAPTITVAWEAPMQCGESPMWHPYEGMWYWIDNVTCHLYQLDATHGTHQIWALPSEPGCIAPMEPNGLIIALRTGYALFNTQSGQLTQYARAPYPLETTRFNDGRCDALGRFWVGTIYEPHDQPNAGVYTLDQGVVRKQWGNIRTSNGLAFSPDHTVLYHADTAAHVIRQYDFDLATGAARNPRIFKQFPSDRTDKNYQGRPDGAAVDSEGAYWCAMYEGGTLLRFAPNGDLLHTTTLPVRRPTMLAFGGSEYRTLLITTARHKQSIEEQVAYPLSGCTFMMEVDVCGRSEYCYKMAP